MSVLSPLDKALTARFRGDATLMALLPGGYHSGSAPAGSTRPYLVSSNPTELEANVFGRWGQDATIEIDTYSAASVKSPAQVNAILDRVEFLLRTPLTLDGHTAVRLKKDFRTVLVENDDTRHGNARYRLLTFESTAT